MRTLGSLLVVLAVLIASAVSGAGTLVVLQGACAYPNEVVALHVVAQSDAAEAQFFQAVIEYDTSKLVLQWIEIGQHAAKAGWTLTTNLDLPFGPACSGTNRAILAQVAGAAPIAFEGEEFIDLVAVAFKFATAAPTAAAFHCQCAEGGRLTSFVTVDGADLCWGDAGVAWLDGCIVPWGQGGCIQKAARTATACSVTPLPVRGGTWGGVKGLFR